METKVKNHYEFLVMVVEANGSNDETIEKIYHARNSNDEKTRRLGTCLSELLYSEKFFSFELDCCEDAFKYDEETILLMCSDFIKKHFGDKYNPGYVTVCVLKDGDEHIVKRYLKIPSTKKGFNLICVHG